jgi:hypothetical protein
MVVYTLAVRQETQLGSFQPRLGCTSTDYDNNLWVSTTWREGETTRFLRTLWGLGVEGPDLRSLHWKVSTKRLIQSQVLNLTAIYWVESLGLWGKKNWCSGDQLKILGLYIYVWFCLCSIWNVFIFCLFVLIFCISICAHFLIFFCSTFPPFHYSVVIMWTMITAFQYSTLNYIFPSLPYFSFHPSPFILSFLLH